MARCSLVSLFGSLGTAGCASIPKGRAAVDDVDFRGQEELTESELEDTIATRESAHFLGLFEGVVYDYEVFNIYVLQRDLQRVERYYRARGFYQARVRASRVFYDDPKHVRVRIVVEEGEPTLIRRLEVRGLEGLPRHQAEEIKKAVMPILKVGDRFDEQPFADFEGELRKALTERGYAFAKVTRVAEVDMPRNFAALAYDVVPGVPASIGAVTFEGLGELPEAPIRAAFDVKAGDSYSSAELDSGQRALLDLGIFTSVRVEPVIDDAAKSSRIVPLKVKLDPTRLRALRVGGGLQIDSLRTDVHVLAGWEDRNFLGGLRHFSVEFKPGVVLYPTRIPGFQAPTALLPEERLRVELRQPGFLEPRTNAFVRGEFNIFPVLLSEDVDEDAPVIGYREIRGAVGLDRKFGRFFVSPSHNVQANQPFTYIGVLDPDLDPILISYPQLLGSVDLRDDAVSPHKGVFLETDLQYAGAGGDARDVKVRSEIRGYVPLGKPVTLGLRATVGLLFPQNYGTSIASTAAGILPPPEVDRGGWVRDSQLALLRGFFSGGPASNRGYALRGVGPHGAIPFYSPDLAPEAIADRCIPGNPAYSRAVCELPLGGFTLWEASVELRFPLMGPLDGVTFCDSSDVSPNEVDFRFNRLHLSCGPGLRYGTPVGPVRLDIGYRVPSLQVLGNDDSGEGTPGTILGVPIAVSLGIGETF
jgi:outer membrane protein insertion porin family/translocation and assembly module TamA